MDEKNPSELIKGINNLKEKNQHPRDKRIWLRDSDHTYFIAWEEEAEMKKDADLLSGTGFVHSKFPEFDSDMVAKRIVNGRNYEQSKYAGMSAEDIKELWKQTGLEACTKGTKMHLEIEMYYNGVEVPFPITKEYYLFLQFARTKWELGWKPYRTEWQLFTDRKSKLCGTIDMLYLSPNQDQDQNVLHLIMVDWKRSKEIKKNNRFGKGHGMCSLLPHCNFYHYTLQLNLYKFIIENYYKNITYNKKQYQHIKIDAMSLGVFHPNQERWLEYTINDYQYLISDLVKERKVCLGEEPCEKKIKLQ